MKILIIIIALGLLSIAGYASIVWQKNRNFNRFLKPGDLVRFYENEEKRHGKIILMEMKKGIAIIDWHGEQYCKLLDDLYPIMGVRYSPKKP